MSDREMRWFHSQNEESCYCDRGFATREEVVADGTREYEGEPFWIGHGRQVDEEDFAGWARHRLAGDLEDGRFEEDNEIASDDPLIEFSKQDEEDLERLIAEFVRERKLLSLWWHLEIVEQVKP